MAKQVIILRKDLGMRKGKMVAQGAHASLAALLAQSYTMAGDRPPDCRCIPLEPYAVEQWLNGRFTKICVGCDSEHELFELYNKAKQAGLLCSLIQDAGLTEFGGIPTYTAVGIGPADDEDIDTITGHLKLL